jgi:hypothetical protein
MEVGNGRRKDRSPEYSGLRKERKEQIYSVLTLRTLRLFSVLCG